MLCWTRPNFVAEVMQKFAADTSLATQFMRSYKKKMLQNAITQRKVLVESTTKAEVIGWMRGFSRQLDGSRALSQVVRLLHRTILRNGWRIVCQYVDERKRWDRVVAAKRAMALHSRQPSLHFGSGVPQSSTTERNERTVAEKGKLWAATRIQRAYKRWRFRRFLKTPRQDTSLVEVELGVATTNPDKGKCVVF